jgi:hypothetical protein
MRKLLALLLSSVLWAAPVAVAKLIGVQAKETSLLLGIDLATGRPLLSGGAS